MLSSNILQCTFYNFEEDEDYWIAQQTFLDNINRFFLLNVYNLKHLMFNSKSRDTFVEKKEEKNYKKSMGGSVKSQE